MLLNPAFNMSQDGIDFAGMGVGGRAEVRAYYFRVRAVVVLFVVLCRACPYEREEGEGEECHRRRRRRRRRHHHHHHHHHHHYYQTNGNNRAQLR